MPETEAEKEPEKAAETGAESEAPAKKAPVDVSDDGIKVAAKPANDGVPLESNEAKEEAPVYKHSLTGHDVQGDGTFKEVNDADRPYEGGVENAQNLPDLEVFAEASGMKKRKTDEEKVAEEKAKEPLPEIPKMPMTVDDAYTFLAVKDDDRGNLDKVKMRFRKMSLKYHPDKNMDREEEAAEVFRAVHAAYHFLTTNNFDYQRWAENFVIPPMQTLEDVLLMAFKGADPYQLELLLKKRGDYRPHAEFGINLSIPWSAGQKDDPMYHVHAGSAYHNTKGLGEGTKVNEIDYTGLGGMGGVQIQDGAIVTTTQGMDQEDLLQSFGEKALVGADASRPWETVGGVGFDKKPAPRAEVYVPPKMRDDIEPDHADALVIAEEFNEKAVKAFKKKEWMLCHDLAAESIRLNPRKTAYLGNRAAAALKIAAQGGGKAKRFLRTASEDSITAYTIDKSYKKAYLRAAEAHMLIGERHTVRLACKELQKALNLDEDDQKVKGLLKEAQLEWEAEYA